MKDGDIVRLRSDGFHKPRSERSAFGRRSEFDFSPAVVDDLDEALLVDGVAGGLKHGGEDGRLVGAELLEFSIVVVIENHMSAEDLLDNIERILRDCCDGGVVEGEDGDGLASVDLFEEMSFGEIIIESTELRELIEESGDVEGGSGG